MRLLAWLRRQMARAGCAGGLERGRPTARRSPIDVPGIRHIRSLPAARRALLVALVALAAAPATASADYRQAIRDCAADGTLHQSYSQSDIRKALQHLPQDINEYTDCYDVLTRALNQGGGTGGTGGPLPANPALRTASGAQAASPQDLGALNGIVADAGRRHPRHPPRIAIDGRPGLPPTGAINLAAHATSNSLPGSVLASLIALAAVAALAGGVATRRHVPAIRRALRIFRR